MGRSPGLLREPIRVLRVPDPLPRAYAVTGIRVADGWGAYQALLDPSFDPRHEVVLANGPARAAAPLSARVRILERRPDRLRIQARVDAPATIVVTEAFDPGWRAWVDGRSTPVWRANVAFRAIPVPAGDSTIVLAYRPRSVRLGSAVGAGALLGTLWLLLRSPRRTTAGPAVTNPP